MEENSRWSWLEPVRAGLIGGAVIVLIALVGMIGRFSERAIVEGIISLGRTLFLGLLFMTAYNAAHRAVKGARSAGVVVGSGAVAGLMAALVVSLLVMLGGLVNLREMFINATAELYGELTLGGTEGNLTARLPLLLGVGALIGALAGAVHLLPSRVRHALSVGVITVLLVALLGELILLSNLSFKNVFNGWLLASTGLTLSGALLLLGAVTAFNLAWQTQGRRVQAQAAAVPPRQRQVIRGLTLVVLVGILAFLPRMLGDYHSEVLNQVGLFVLLGLGLNIVVGFTGMLDLGYVAFFALGAYTVGVLTSAEGLLADRGMTLLTFWGALPFAIVVAVAAGVMLGVPVLRMRGDYLAIVTLGFGEIIQRLAVSNWLKPIMGGAQGIAGITPITLPAIPFLLPEGLLVAGQGKPQKLFFFILIACLLAAFIATRLKHSRLGRAWMAIREDEDVAEAMGINLVSTKLVAFAVGAGLSGLSGALFGAKLGSIYPHSFGLLISINILALIIVGGMGSIPGVILGALVLVGLPELLREFVDFRLLVYGAVLVFMMLRRPEGLLPDTAHRRELHDPLDNVADPGLDVAPVLATVQGPQKPM